MADIRPIPQYPYSISSNCVLFRNQESNVRIYAPTSLLTSLFAKCDGTKTIDDIVGELKSSWREETLRDLFSNLIENELLVDGKSFIFGLWPVLRNPSPYPAFCTDAEISEHVQNSLQRHKVTPHTGSWKVAETNLQQNLNKRESTRTFDGESVPWLAVVQMLWSGYGVVDQNLERRVVPSAGMFYPLRLSLVLFKQHDELPPGVYDVVLARTNEVAVSRKSSASVLEVAQAFLDPSILESAAGVVVLSGSFTYQGMKYGNRSLLYMALEAGHAAQNMHSSATESGVATVEIGGFIDTALSGALGLPSDFMPLTTVIFGNKGVVAGESGIEVEWVVPFSQTYRTPFHIAMARVSHDINEDWAYGRGSEPSLARVKAVSEAKEWAACGCVPSDLTRSSRAEVGNHIPPWEIIKYHEHQYRQAGFPFQRFDEDHEYEWVKTCGYLEGNQAYVLADHVFFPYFPASPLYTYANSSGVAAHPDEETALQKAVLELVERDSFMIAYLAKLTLPTISDLPIQFQRRFAALAEAGFDTIVTDGTVGLAPTIHVFVQNKDLHYTTCSACSGFNLEEVLDHALMESEASVLARIQNGPAKALQPRMVAMPADHGGLYEQRSYFARANFMFSGRTIRFTEVGKSGAKSWQDLVTVLRKQNHNIYQAHLELPKQYGGGNDGLSIIRAIVPGLVPMTFGYAQEPLGVERLYRVAREYRSRVTHAGRVTKFPHPFA